MRQIINVSLIGFFIVILGISALFLLAFGVKETFYVDSAGKSFIENEDFEVTYLCRKNEAHCIYPDTGRDSLMTEIKLKERKDNLKIKNINYELTSGNKTIQITTYSTSNTLERNDLPITDTEKLDKQYEIDKRSKTSVFVIIDNIGFFDRKLHIKYDLIISDSAKEYRIAGSKDIFRTTEWSIDF